MSSLHPAPAAPTVEVLGRTERYFVHRIYCVGRNYAAHAREMGMDPEREPPFFFSKPADAVVPNGQSSSSRSAEAAAASKSTPRSITSTATRSATT
jgi:2-keto-4-pentenoate hydratase/2-oxohepta-3-ene-1,7-dioic acid hydratase in catechol pathway